MPRMNARQKTTVPVQQPGSPRSPRMTTSSKAPQSKVKGPDKWGVVHYICSRCDITYKMPQERKPVCPLCEEKAKSQNVRDELKKVVNANDLLKRDLTKVRSQLTILDGMREAVSELGDKDAMFLKELVYRYRASPDKIRVSQSVRQRTIEVEGAGTAIRHEVSGWNVDYRDVEPGEVSKHDASSVGGVMLALQFSEALKLVGLKGAMEMLTKAMSKTMANA